MYIRKSRVGCTQRQDLHQPSVGGVRHERREGATSEDDLLARRPRPAATAKTSSSLRARWRTLSLVEHNLLDADAGELADSVTRVQARRPAGKLAHAAPLSSSPRQSGARLIKVDPSRVTTERHREGGPVHIGYQFWQRLELDRILQGLRKLSPAVRRLACVMTLNRLIAPASEHAMPDWIRRARRSPVFSTPTSMGSRKTRSTRCSTSCTPIAPLSRLALVARERSLFDLDQTVYLYDLTSTYFEGVGARNDKAKRGYSRDHRTRLQMFQLVVGLVLNRDGFAITHEIFAR